MLAYVFLYVVMFLSMSPQFNLLRKSDAKQKMKTFQTPLLPGDWQQVNRNNKFSLPLTLLKTLNAYF